MKISLLGNFSVPWTTETHLALSFEALGHEVLRIQEGETRAVDVPLQVEGRDLFTWVQTYSLAEQGGTLEERQRMLDVIRGLGIPSASIHLDRWFGLSREPQVYEQPFFRTDIVFTADGGHDEEWERAGINHVWSPPAVFHGEAVDVPRTGRYRADVCFVGSHTGYGHPEWRPYRDELIANLEKWYRSSFRKWPRGAAIRGLELNRLYASTKVVVGDSCLAGSPRAYVSDRVFETTGRGGFLLHPHVDGIFPELMKPGEHLQTWPIGDWDSLHGIIDYYLTQQNEREEIRRAGAAHVRANHTYVQRLARVIEVMQERNLL